MPNIPDKYKIDFIRGYFDGDGSVGEIVHSQKNRPCTKTQIKLRICSASPDILIGIVDYLFYNNKIPKVKVHHSRINYYEITYSTKSAIKLYEYMYYDSNNLYLKRKKDKFDLLLKGRI